MEQMINGIYASTSPFLLTSVFPPEGSQYNLEVIGGGYRLKYKEGTADIATTMGREYGVTELKVSTPEFISSIQPQYAKTPKGLLISGYQADYAGRSGADQVQVRLGVQMSYQEVAGLQLFQRLNVIATIGSSTNRVEVQFRGCQVKKNRSEEHTSE